MIGRAYLGTIRSMRLRRPFGMCWLLIAGVCCVLGAAASPETRDGMAPQTAELPADNETSDEEDGPMTPPTTARPEELAPSPGISAKFFRHAERLVAKYGGSPSGGLKRSQWAAVPKGLWAADRNGDGVITVDELAEYLAEYSRSRSLKPAARSWPAASELLPLLRPSIPAEPAGSPAGVSAGEKSGNDSASEPRETGSSPGRPPQGKAKFYVAPARRPQGLPDWFTARDLDGDGQLTLGEFAPDGGRAAVEQFQRYDLNHDGLLTAEEVLQAGKANNTKSRKDTRP